MSDPAAVVLIVTAASFAAAYAVRVIAYAVVRHKELEQRGSAPPIAQSDERLARLEVAVESIALEIERISEGQRFTTKLLSEAAQVSAPRIEKPAKINTPH